MAAAGWESVARFRAITRVAAHGHGRRLSASRRPAANASNARLDPRRGIASLAASERDAVIGHARQFSLSWAKGARPALLWYDQTICGACGARLRFCKLGDDAERPTFWCAACCEANEASVRVGWVRSGRAGTPSARGQACARDLCSGSSSTMELARSNARR